MSVPAAAEPVLDRGSLCAVAAPTLRGPHLTPLVFVYSSGRIWLTTSRGSVKARAWRTDPRAAGLIRYGRRNVAFVGRARTHDVLEPSGWLDSALASPALLLASTRFTRKNARFFAGYAVDARRVPLAWTPPGRVFVEIEPDGGLLLEDDRIELRWGRGSREPAVDGSEASFRATRAGGDPLAGLPSPVAERLGRAGATAALAIETRSGPAVLPGGWAAEGDALYAAVPASALELLAADEQPRAALTVDRESWWRARDMVGVMASGAAAVYRPERLERGATSAARCIRLAGGDPRASALVRVRPDRLVWWEGWSSGTVGGR